MDTELLKTFLEVEKTRHFGRAAENLYLTPAAVSARIRQLEGIIGLPLLIRNRNNIGLTPAGEKLKPRAQEVLAALARAIQEPAAAPRGRQQLAIGSTPNLWEFVLPGSLGRIHESHPELSLRAECHDSGYLISQLQSRQLDLAILLDPLVLEGMTCEPLVEIELQLLSTAENLELASLPDLPYLRVDWSVGFGIEHARLYDDSLRPALLASTGKIALDFLLQHPGTCYFPARRSNPLPGLKQLHPVSGAVAIHLTTFILYQKGSKKRSLLDSVTRDLNFTLA